MDETDVDGFNLAYVVMPETYQDIVDLLIPELQRPALIRKYIGRASCEKNCFDKARTFLKHIRERWGVQELQNEEFTSQEPGVAEWAPGDEDTIRARVTVLQIAIGPCLEPGSGKTRPLFLKS